MFEQLTTIVTPDTILRRHRELVAAKWDYSRCRKKIGHPRASVEVVCRERLGGILRYYYRKAA